MRVNKIFLACPISKYIVKNEYCNENFKNFILDAYSICKKHSSEVFLALKREKFGKNLMPDTCTKFDYEEMKSSEIVVAIPEDSKGVAVELGWASAMKKTIILLLDKSIYFSPLIYQIHDITNCKVIWYNDLDKELLKIIDFELAHIYDEV